MLHSRTKQKMLLLIFQFEMHFPLEWRSIWRLQHLQKELAFHSIKASHDFLRHRRIHFHLEYLLVRPLYIPLGFEQRLLQGSLLPCCQLIQALKSPLILKRPQCLDRGALMLQQPFLSPEQGSLE